MKHFILLSQPQRYKIKARTFYGRNVDVPFDNGVLKPAWFPFGKFRGAFLTVWQSNLKVTQCSIRNQSTVCENFRDTEPVDYIVRSLNDTVDFSGWQPFSSDSDVVNSIVKRRFEMLIERQNDHTFSRWSATSSRFSQDCDVLTSNGICQERLPGTFESNRRNWAIVIKQASFPVGKPTSLAYSVQYKNSFTFTPTEQENGCLNCDITFISVYPVNHYRLTMTFPQNWTWKKIIVTQSGTADDSSVTNSNSTLSSTFVYSADSLPAGVHLTFLIFPDDRLPKLRKQ